MNTAKNKDIDVVTSEVKDVEPRANRPVPKVEIVDAPVVKTTLVVPEVPKLVTKVNPRTLAEMERGAKSIAGR